MKFITKLFKLLITFLAICGACYLFIDIVEKINNENKGEDAEADNSFFCQVKSAAKKQLDRIK